MIQPRATSSPSPSGSHAPPDRWLVAAAIVVAAGVTAALPDSGESEPSAEPLDEILSDDDLSEGALVPERTAAIRFSHDSHAETPCRECHDAASSDSATDDLLPEMTTCAECHTAEVGSPTPRPHLSDCKGCHIGYDRSVDRPIRAPTHWRSVRPAPMIPPRPTARISFDHRHHLRTLAEQSPGGPSDPELCASCHAAGADGPTMPTIATCKNCHTDDPGTLEPTNHTVGWERRHGRVARAASSRCEDCHTEDDCASCHSDDSAEPFSVHPPNFETLHAVDARAQSDDCAECHTVETFCRQCHARTDFSPTSPERPSPRTDMHPPNWTEPNAPRNHAVMARRNIADCASCHTENDCVSCHRGVSPHPPEFQLKCRQWLEADPTPCAKCHGNLSRLQSRCL